MPTSRGRKKKPKNKAKNANNRTFESDGIKISQKGNMTYVQNKRTQIEHDQFVNHVIENRPLFYEEIKNDINKVVDDINLYDKISLLGVFSYYGITHQYADDGAGEIMIEYAQSICSASPNVNKGVIPTVKQADAIIKQLTHIRQSFSHYYGSERLIGKHAAVEGNIRANMLLQSLFIRGDGHYQHIKEIFSELFNPHDDFFKKHYDFTSADLLDTFEQLEDSFCCRVVMPDKMPHPASYARFNNWMKNMTAEEGVKRGLHPIVAFGEDNPDIVVKDGHVFTYSIKEPATNRELYKIRPRYENHKKVIEALSIPFGDNSSFLNPDFKAEPLNDSLIYKYPIIREENDYYLFGFNIAARNLIGIAENLIENKDRAYYDSHYVGSRYAITRDKYLESKVEAVFKSFLPSVKFYPNVKYSFYNDGSTINCNKKNEKTGIIETELDLLGIGDDAIYLIEIKAGALKPSAKRGALKSLTGALKDVIGYAACQSYRAHTYITENDNPIFKHGKNEVSVDKEKTIYRIAVSLDHFGELMTYLYDLKELDIIDKKVDFAWTLNIYDLLIFAEIIKDENEFKEYLNGRINLYSRANIVIGDEISLLGFFYKEGDISFADPKINKLDTFRINSNYASDIDNYFMKKQSGLAVEKPQRKLKRY